MNAKMIKDLASEGEGVAVSIEIMSNIPEFKESFTSLTPESIALIVDGHNPITELRFSFRAVERWCNDNKIQFCVDRLSDIIHMRRV